MSFQKHLEMVEKSLAEQSAASRQTGYVGASFSIEDMKSDMVTSPDGSEQMQATFSGFASTFGNVDRHDDVIEPGAFSGLSERNSRGALKVKMFAGHDSRMVPGIWTRLTQNDAGLWAEGKLLLGTQIGSECYEQLKSGAIDSLSVGFRIPKGGYWLDEKEDGDMVRHITKAELMEISLVAIPANPQALISSVKEFDAAMTARELERLLQNRLGMSRREAKALITHGYAGIAMRDDDEHEAEVVNSNAKCDVQEAEAQARKTLQATAAFLSALRELKRNS